jgi:hypothetical protein
VNLVVFKRIAKCAGFCISLGILCFAGFVSCNSVPVEIEDDAMTEYYTFELNDNVTRTQVSYRNRCRSTDAARAGMETYWRWTAEKGMDWHSIPREKRLEPPDAVAGIFEENGFLWGGKWPWYDTMHFEYRPEILLLSW